MDSSVNSLKATLNVSCERAGDSRRERFLRVPVTENGRLVIVVSRPDVLSWIIEPNFMTFS